MVIQAEERVRRQTDLLQKTLNSIDEAIFVLDAGNPPRILECNDAASSMFGYNKKELLGRTTDFLHVSDKTLKEFQSRLFAAVEQNRLPVHLPGHSMKHKDGSVFPSEHFVSQLVNDKGERNGWVRIVRDITELKRGEEALRRRAEKLAALQSTVLDITRTQDLPTLLHAIVERAVHLLRAPSGGLYICDAEKREVRCVVSYNTPKDYTGAVLKYGEGAAGHVAETGEPLVVDDYRVWSGRATAFEREQPFTALLSTPMIWQGHVRGVIHVLDSEARRFTRSDLELLALFADHAAIALENQRSLEALRDNEERFRKVFEEGPFGMALVRPDYRFARVNKTFCTMLGYSEEELTALKFTDITHPDEIKLGVELSQKLFRGEIPSFSVEKRYIKKNGETLSARLTASFIRDREGTPIYSLAMIEDITEQKRTEKKLRKSEERFREAMDATNDGLWDWNVETGEIHYSPAYYRMLGYEPGAFPEHIQSWKDLIHPDDRDRVFRANDDCIENRIAKFEVELRMRAKAGDWKWILGRGKASVRDTNGRALRMIGTHVDITERKRAEEELRQSEERYRSLFDRMLDGIYLSTHEGRFVDVNPAFVKMFGYSSKQEILGIADIKKELYFSPEERGSHILDTGQEEVEVYLMRRKDGSKVWVEDHGRYAHDVQGNVIFHEGILRDVTERRRLEEELTQHSLQLEKLVDERTRKLRESEEELRAARERLEYVVTSNPAAIYSSKPLADYSDWHLTYLSDRVTAMLGFEPQKFIGHPEFWESHVHPDDLRPTLGTVPRVFKEGMSTFDYRFLHKDGTYRWIREEAKVIRDANGKPIEVNGYWTDITELKKIELRLAESERLAAIGQTAAMVGHDLRNPLQGIAGALHLLKQESLTAEERNEMLHVIEKSLDYSDAIIRDLSYYSTEIQLKLADATPKSITRDAIRAVRVPQNIIVQDLSEDQPTLRVDPERMRRVFINLIENAIDAMPQGGTLTISSKKSDGNVEIALADTGSGMPEMVIANLWKPLQTTKAKGLGLGLAICKRILDAHGGIMSVKSIVGGGTTLTMQLPIRSVEVKQK